MKMQQEIMLLEAEYAWLTSQRKHAEAAFVHRKLKRLKCFQLMRETERIDEDFIDYPATEDRNAVRTN